LIACSIVSITRLQYPHFPPPLMAQIPLEHVAKMTTLNIADDDLTRRLLHSTPNFLKRRVSALLWWGFGLLLVLGFATSLFLLLQLRRTVREGKAIEAATSDVRDALRGPRAEYIDQELNRLLLSPKPTGKIAEERMEKRGSDERAGPLLRMAVASTHSEELRHVLRQLKWHDVQDTDPIEEAILTLVPTDLAAAREMWLGRYLPSQEKNRELVEKAQQIAVEEIAGMTRRSHDEEERAENWSYLAIAAFLGLGIAAATFLTRAVAALVRQENASAIRVKQSEERFQFVSRATHDGLWDWNLATNSVWYSESFASLLGYSPGQITPTVEVLTACIHPDDYRTVSASLNVFLASHEDTWSAEFRFRRADGSYAFVFDRRHILRDAVGRPLRMVGSLMDITKRKQAEEVLSESERRFREMLENVELVAMTLDKNGIVTFCNDYLLRLTGWTREEVLGAEWFAKFLPEDNMSPKGMFLDNIHAGNIPAHLENPIKTKTGELREIAWNNTMLRDLAGEIVGTASLGEDVTERNRAEARVREQQEAERANRAKSEFLSRMSHELRTPLNAILGFAQLLEMDARKPDDAESISHILRAGKHLLSMINEVLDLARIESGKLALRSEPLSICEALEETLSLVRPLAAARRVHLKPLAGDLDCEVLASAQRVRQAILNLLSNAVKYNREGGSVAVSCEKLADCVRIKVTDDGRGITADNMAKLFVPFERLDVGDTVVEGTGLGLSLTKHLVQAMGGRIGVESAHGEGSTFWVELPLVHRAPGAVRKRLAVYDPKGDASPLPVIPRTLLYIEDNLANLRLVELILERRKGVKLISARQGTLGLELARQLRPDLILLDLYLPDIQGEEILRQLRADPRTEHIPIVIVSADALPAHIDQLRFAGANDYLTKPIDVRKFLELIDTTEPCHKGPLKLTPLPSFAA
jgi:PAS domain S-box-containing protein